MTSDGWKVLGDVSDFRRQEYADDARMAKKPPRKTRPASVYIILYYNNGSINCDMYDPLWLETEGSIGLDWGAR